MSWARVWTIFRKDLRDAIRDARVLVALIVPLGIGVFYNFTFDDRSGDLTAQVVYTVPDASTLPEELNAILGGAVTLRFDRVPAEQVGPLLRDDKADIGLVLPAGFDAEVAAGRQPRVTVVRPTTPTYATDVITAAIEPAVARMAGRAPPVAIDVTSAAAAGQPTSIADKIGVRTWAILGSIVTMLAMIGMLAVPVILAEETEKKTLDALVLIASYAEVIVAKALVGVAYSAVMVPLLLAITGVRPSDWLLFLVAVALLAVVLIGLGLLMAGLFKSANQLNTWSGVLLLPVIAPAFAIGLPTPDWVQTLMGALPSGQAAKLLINSAASEQAFPHNPAYIAGLVAWGALAYGLLLWQLRRRQA